MQIFLRFIYITCIIGFIYAIQYLIQMWGERHYSRDGGGEGGNPIFDITHINTPSLYKYSWIANIIPLAMLLVLFVGANESDLITEFFFKFLFILVIRAIVGISTILPKHEECQVKFDLQFLLEGGCYDKLFSGHTAIVTLISVLLAREGFMSNWVFWITNIINMALIVLTRSHYTADVLLGFVIAYLVGNGDYGVLPH